MAAPKKPANNAPVFGRWQAIRPIGRGGFGQTIEVKHLDTNKFAIVKVINSDHYGDDYHDYVRRFAREIKFLSEMDHPNICRLYEANFDSDQPWFAMERYKGNTVAEELEQYGPAPEKIWFDRARDILSALKYAHGKKIIHGDLNPGNVIIDGRGAKLIDFGIARRDGNYSSNSTRIFGANGWTSPQYGALEPSVHDDIFVAASLLVLLGTGHHAFKANTVNNFLPSIVDDEPDYRGLSTNQIQLVRKMHEKSREKRCSAASALADIDRLEPSATSRPIIAKAPVAKKPVVKGAAVFPKQSPQAKAEEDEAQKRFSNRPLPMEPRITISLPELLRLYKGLVISSFFLGFAPAIAYFIISKTKRTKFLGYSEKLPLAITSLVYFLTFGILSPFVTFWWAMRLGFKSLNLQLLLQTIFFVNFFVAVGAESEQASSDIATIIFLIGVVNSFYGFKKVKDLLVASTNGPMQFEDQPVKPPAPPTTKVEIRESDGGSQIVGTQRSWAEVETFFVQALSNKRGKRFIFEIESDLYTDIYFQGYSEPDLSRTIEAAADLSVRPKLTDAQKLSMSVIG